MPNIDAKSGFFWHVHHDVLLEWSHNIDERIAYVKSDKPAKEVKLRLRLMKPVQGKLPKKVVEAGKAYGKAWKVYDEARKVYNEAKAFYNKANKKSCDEACKVWNEACKVRDKAWKVCDEAGNDYCEAIWQNLPAIEALHLKECPNCPWDGKTIFPKKGGKHAQH